MLGTCLCRDRYRQLPGAGRSRAYTATYATPGITFVNRGRIIAADERPARIAHRVPPRPHRIAAPAKEGWHLPLPLGARSAADALLGRHDRQAVCRRQRSVEHDAGL